MKNIVTSLPIAAAPLAMMNAAIALSKSPLKTTMVLFFWLIRPPACGPAAAPAAGWQTPFFWMVAGGIAPPA